MSYDWKCSSSSDRDNVKRYLPCKEAFDHPLRATGIIVCESRDLRKQGSQISSRTSSTVSLDPLTLDGSDPLSHFARIDSAEIDPLSRIAGDYSASSNNKNKVDFDAVDNAVVAAANSWATRRSSILTKYTTVEKLTIVSSFLHGGELIRTQTTISEKVKNRLEQLDDFDDASVHKMNDLSQQEYQLRVEQLNQELVQAWKTDQRVRALKIAIQCSKLLADTSVLPFYPSQFVCITDILDNFGKLVYERLRTKAEYFEPGSNVAKALPENFTPNMVSGGVKETCLNWFYKIASIRELLPRLYLEIAILKSYSFLSQSDFKQSLLRLSEMIRGVGDPLVAAYARCYLCRVGATVTKDSTHLKENLDDFLFVYHTILLGGIRTDLAHQRIDISDYLGLYAPALDWIMYSLVINSTECVLDEILTKCQEKKNNGLLLHSILLSYKPSFIATRANKFVHILVNSNNDGITKGQLFRALGLSLCRYAPSEDQQFSVLNGAWKTINTLTQASEFIQCVEPWTEYAAAHFGVKEIDNILSEIIVRMNQNRSFERHYAELQSIFNSIVDNVNDLEALFTLENFLLFIDLFQKDSQRFDVCKKVITAYKAKVPTPLNEDELNSSDAVVTNALMYIGKTLNDGINAATSEDEQRQVTQLISHFVRTVRFGRDFEQQLTFYVEARATFPNLDGVFITLVQCVNLLAIKTRRIIHGRHTRKTSAFVKSCAAYCFITIPSISSVRSRMDLYLMSGQVALLNLCFGQADSFFETSINLIKELPKTCEIDGKPKSTENYLIAFISNLLSTLIVVPDSPEQGVLYLVRKLMDTIKQLSFETESACLARIYLLILSMLLVMAQEKYPYHIPNVISNDELYGSDPKFIAEIHSMCSNVVELMLAQLKLLGSSNNVRAQCCLALELFLKLVNNANVSEEKTFSLAINLWNLAMKNRKSIDSQLPGKMLMKVQNLMAKTTDHQLRQALDQLTTKMKIKM